MRGRGEGGTKPPHLGPRTRLLLTDAGIASITKQAQIARNVDQPSPSGQVPGEGESPTATSPVPSPSRLLPHYNIETRELSVAGVVILRLPVQARNLAAVLAALHATRWKPRVARPLNGSRGGNDHHHLANVALSLNGHQNLIKFSSDDGAICWVWRSLGDFRYRRNSANHQQPSPAPPVALASSRGRRFEVGLKLD